MEILKYSDKNFILYDSFEEAYEFEIQPYYDRKKFYDDDKKGVIYPLPIQLGSKHSIPDGQPKFFFREQGKIWKVAKDSKLISFVVANNNLEKDPFVIVDQDELEETKLKLAPRLEEELKLEGDKMRVLYKKLGWRINFRYSIDEPGFNVYEYKIPKVGNN